MTTPNVLPEQSLLLNIINTARRVQSRLLDSGFKPATVTSQIRDVPLPPLNIPFPCDLIACVEESAAPLPLQSGIIARIAQWHKEVECTLQDEYAKTLHRLGGISESSKYPVQDRLHKVYESLFTQKAQKFYADVEHGLQRAAARGRNASHKEKRKRPFNHECLPLLEAYFKYNAYPFPQDRVLLAKKTAMSTRQIEVWFQNHRTRAKKEGRELKRLSQNPSPCHIDFEPLNESTESVAPKVEEVESPVKAWYSAPTDAILCPSLSPDRQAIDPLCAASSACAFPAKYPPTPGHESCLLGSRSWSFPPPVWPRRPSSKAPARKTTTADELAVELQLKLSITGAEGTKRARSHTTGPKSLAAPHPALIRQSVLCRSKRASKVPFIPPAIRMACSSTQSPFSKYIRPAPYRSPQKRSSSRRSSSLSTVSSSSSSLSLSSISSSGESVLRTPSPSPATSPATLLEGIRAHLQYPD
ncbi:hypothetical protein NMY22_g17575 [Coprinellus aureogranulatus]|nr:hypothetical protein NMY22_g17575 [Coprinellus aureogranulatus]